MVWIENPTSRNNGDIERWLQEQGKLAEQKEKSRPPESEQDTRLKMGLWVLVGDFKWKMTEQSTEWKARLQTMKEKGWFLNSLSPENFWGYSWLVNGVKDSIQAWEMKFDTAKTNSELKTDIVEAYSELLNRRLIALPKLEYLLQSWQRWEDMRNEPDMRQFFITPEGEYMLALARSENPKDAEATYVLAKARELKKYIPKGEIYAEPLYEQLKGTKYESIANQEKMNITEIAWKKYISEVGNELLGTDSLAIMAISGPVWWALTKALQWERAVAITQNSIKAVNKSGVAKILVPWVQLLEKEVSNTVIIKLGKWAFNIAVEATKIVTYTEAVRKLGWNDAAKYASYIFLFIPWAKLAFERDMLNRPASLITSETILSWALSKIWPDKLKQFFRSQAAWTEVNTSQAASWAEQAVQEIQELAKITTVNTGTTETGKQAIEKWWERMMEVVKKTQERVEQQLAIEWQKWSSNLPQEKGITLIDSPKYITLYEDPNYRYFAWEKYQQLREIFPKLSNRDILWEWQNAIILQHPNKWNRVLKVAKEWARDDINKEFNNHQTFFTTLEKWKIDFPRQLSDTIKIPEIKKWNWEHFIYFEMEKIDGQSFKTLFYREQYATQLEKNYSQVELSLMNDAELEKVVKELWLDTIPSILLTWDGWFSKSLFNQSQTFMWNKIRNPLTKQESELWNTLSFLDWKWLRHTDMHSWNFMISKDGKTIYIIDFWNTNLNVKN